MVWRKAVAVGALAGMCGLLGACGGAQGGTSGNNSGGNGGSGQTAGVASNGGTGSCDMSHVNKAIAAHLAKATSWSPPGPAFSATKAKGALIYTIEESDSNPFDENIVKAIKTAGNRVGAKVVNYPNQGQPGQWIQGINQAIAAHAKVIIFTGGTLGPKDFRPAAARAVQSGIKLVTVVATDVTQSKEKDVAARVAQPYTTAARLDADWIIKQTHCKAHVLLMTTTGLLAGNVNTIAAQQEFSKYCGKGCSVRTVNVPLTSWSTKIQPDVQSAVQADPKLNYVFPLYDAMVQYAIPGIRVAGATGRVHVASFNGTPGILRDIQTGQTLTMDIGENEANLGYAAMDQAMRLIAGAPVVANGNENIRLRVFDKSNVKQAGVPPRIGVGYGSAWRSGYLKLWGLGS